MVYNHCQLLTIHSNLQYLIYHTVNQQLVRWSLARAELRTREQIKDQNMQIYPASKQSLHLKIEIFYAKLTHCSREKAETTEN